MPRPRSLTQDQLAAAALDVIDHDGLSNLTMRAVAQRLGMSTMALYRYVEDRDELEGLVIGLVLDGIDTTTPTARTWQEQVHVMACRLRDAVSAHPAVIPLTLTHRHTAVASLRWGETVLEILTQAGIEGRSRVIALRAILAYVTGAIQLENLGPLSGEGTNVIAALPHDQFPYMAATAVTARDVPPEEEFRQGLAALLEGLRA